MLCSVFAIVFDIVIFWDAEGFAMFNIQDVRLEDTRAYKEIAEKQTQSVQVKFVIMQLNEKLGKLPDNLQARVSVLPSEVLDTIGRALLYFQNIQDLVVWLDEFG